MASLAAIYDDATFRHLDRFGIREGACCLEVGAGGGSVAAFMKQRAGPNSQVIATDINIDWMVDTLPAGIDVRRHDIGVDPLPEAMFDITVIRSLV